MPRFSGGLFTLSLQYCAAKKYCHLCGNKGTEFMRFIIAVR
jgi:hypothetical protein